VRGTQGYDGGDRRTQLARREERLRRRAQHLETAARRYAVARLAIFFGGILAAALCWGLAGVAAGVIAAGLAALAFGVVVVLDNRIEDAVERYTLLARAASAQRARLDLDWPRLPPARAPGPGLASPDHPFAADLDLVGACSLHRLIDTAVTREGGELLREWLLTPAPDGATTRLRQARVRALARRTPFRDKLFATAITATGGAWDGADAARWLAGCPADPFARSRAVGLGLLVVIAAVALLVGVFTPGLNHAFALVPLALAAGLYLWRRRLVRPYIAGVRALDATLEGPRRVFAYLETRPAGAIPPLDALYAPLRGDGDGAGRGRASVVVTRVARLTGLATLQESLAWPVINLFAPLDLFLAYRLSHDTALLATDLPRWLGVWFELEALSSLANLAYLHPDYAFPAIRDDLPAGEGAEPPVFRARGIGHPLIPEGRAVVNDFTVDRLGDIALITGSNMAGKSSLLRTLGVNLCLAYAGGPVAATELDTIVFRPFTSIAVADSVTAGYSYFYAEVRRLKALLTALEQEDAPPLFFLVDEIFRGTNNRERLLGGRAYLRALAGRRGVGAVSTHDLGLVELADESPRITVYHFRDDVVDGALVFDYTLRPGPAPTTNALTIMRLAGLPVP